MMNCINLKCLSFQSVNLLQSYFNWFHLKAMNNYIVKGRVNAFFGNGPEEVSWHFATHEVVRAFAFYI